MTCPGVQYGRGLIGTGGSIRVADGHGFFSQQRRDIKKLLGILWKPIEHPINLNVAGYEWPAMGIGCHLSESRRIGKVSGTF